MPPRQRTTSPGDELLRPAEVARLLNWTEKQVAYARRAGYGPPYQKLGYKTVRYRASEVQAWIREREQTPQPRRVTSEVIMETLQQIIATCFMDNMVEPLELRISDRRGQRGGAIIHWDRDPEPLPDGTPSSWDHGYPPFTVQVTDAGGECRTFDIGIVRAADGRQVPDVRPTRH